MEMTDFEIQWWIENNLSFKENEPTYCPDCENEVVPFDDKIVLTHEELVKLLKDFKAL